MENIGQWFSYGDTQRLEINIAAISNFPDNDQAQIKANNAGTLGRADGGVASVNWMVNWAATKTGLATELEGTITAIENTFNTVENNLDKNIKKLNKNNINKDCIVSLKDDLSKELNMIEGLKNIQAVYKRRYETSNEKTTSLNKLDVLVDKHQKIIESHGDVFKNIIDDYRASLEAKQKPFDLTQSIINPLPATEFTTDESMSRLDAYLHTWCHGISLKEALHFIEEGKAIYGKIVQGQIKEPGQLPVGEETALTHLSWFLMSCALKKKQGHSQGSFAIEDPKGRLYNFLIRAQGCGDRPSSHYLGRSAYTTGATTSIMKSSAHKGIDVTNEKLPAEKRHLLFGQVDAVSKNDPNPLLFLKMEDFSPFMTTGYGYDMAMHGADLVIAQYNKKFKPGSDDLPDMAKERIPTEVLKNFEKVIQPLKNLLPQIQEKLASKGFSNEAPMKAAKMYGIAYMTTFIEVVNDLEEKPLEYDASPFVESLPPLDHMHKRTGREVYLSVEDLANV